MAAMCNGWHRVRLQPEYRAECLALRNRQRIDPIQVRDRTAQADVSELQFRLNTRRQDYSWSGT